MTEEQVSILLELLQKSLEREQKSLQENQNLRVTLPEIRKDLATIQENIERSFKALELRPFSPGGVL